MSLDETVLQKVADWRPSGKERQTLNVPHAESGWALTLTADRCDEVGCLVWELGLRRTREAEVSVTLADWAHRTAGRVTGLVEALRVVEIDAPRDEALLRSGEPTQRGGGLFYYEVLLKGTREAVVRRYKAVPNGGKREQIAFALTHETLAKLAKDLAGE
jgi:hypothetical protein